MISQLVNNKITSTGLLKMPDSTLTRKLKLLSIGKFLLSPGINPIGCKGAQLLSKADMP